MFLTHFTLTTTNAGATQTPPLGYSRVYCNAALQTGQRFMGTPNLRLKKISRK